MSTELYSSIVGTEEHLAAFGSDGHLKAFFWPHKDAFHQHVEFCIMGVATEGKPPLWLDPKRDSLQLSHDPATHQLTFDWTPHHPDFQGLRIRKTISLVKGAGLLEKVTLTLPVEYRAEGSLQLWYLFGPEIAANRRFQCIGADQHRKGWLFAFSGSTTLGFYGFAGEETDVPGFLEIGALQKGTGQLGHLLEDFLKSPKAYRKLEMGKVLGCAVSRPLTLLPKRAGSHFLSASFQTLLFTNVTEKEILSKFDELKADGHFRAPNVEAPLPRDPTDFDSFLRTTSMSVLKALTGKSGAIVAAPEMDFDYKKSGGYGYVWPRDAAFCALSLIENDERQWASQILHYLVRVQEVDGDFFQRYTSEGRRAPSWAFRQADQIGLCCVAFASFLERGPDTVVQEALRKGILKILSDFEEKGTLEESFDLWEESYGQHFYAHICAYEALERAKTFFPNFQERIIFAQKKCFIYCVNNFMEEERVARRGISQDGLPDKRLDVSLLACVFPCSSFPLSLSAKLQLWEDVAGRLLTPCGALRYERDSYMSGQPWTLSTFWLACAASELSEHSPDLKKKALNLYKLTTLGANDGGFCQSRSILSMAIQPGSFHLPGAMLSSFGLRLKFYLKRREFRSHEAHTFG